MVENTLNFNGLSDKIVHQFMLWCAMRTLQRCKHPNPKWVQCLYIKQDWLDGKKTFEELERALKWVRSIAWGEVLGARWSDKWPEERDEQWRAMETVCWALQDDVQHAEWVSIRARFYLDPNDDYNESQTQERWLFEARRDSWHIHAQQQRLDLLRYLESLGERDERLLYAFGR